MSNLTDKARRADLLLKEGLAAYLRSHRDAPPRPRSWDAIALDLAERTKREVVVNGETVRQWHLQLNLTPVRNGKKARTR